MGVVSRILTDRFIIPEAGGEFQISYYPVGGQVLVEHEKRVATMPLIVEGGKIHSGYLSLVPVTAKSLYHAWISVGNR